MARSSMCLLGLVTVFVSSGRLLPLSVSAPRFEAASIREHRGPIPRIGVSTSGVRLMAEACSIPELLLYAYDLKPYQLARGAELRRADARAYDVIAVAEGHIPPSTPQFRQMMQSLLEDRFGLIVHTQTKQLPIYALMIGKRGVKLKASIPDAESVSNLSVIGRNYHVTNPKASAADIVAAISNSFPDRPVLDKTGLTGNYQLELTFTPNLRKNAEPLPDDLDIFTAVQEQLGLKLQPEQAPMRVLVVDHVEFPSDN